MVWAGHHPGYRKVERRADARNHGAGKVRAEGEMRKEGVPPAKYTLTRYLRAKLKKPWGEFFPPLDVRTARFEASFSTAPLVITVGDRVTDTLAELGRAPDVHIIDLKERRQGREASSAPFNTLIRVRNPPGGLTTE